MEKRLGYTHSRRILVEAQAVIKGVEEGRAEEAIATGYANETI